MKFLGNVFTNFIFEILLSHEALVMESVTATTTSNNQTQPFKPLQMKKNCSSDIGSFDSFRTKSLPKLFHVLNHFHLVKTICEFFQVFSDRNI